MRGRFGDSGIRVFATCPPSYTATPAAYLRQVVEVSRSCDAAGCSGILVYTDNGIVEPWLVAQEIIAHTTRLAPLVAVQPVYAHPFAVARTVASLGFLHGRRVCLNMVAGGFRNDLFALDDPTPHDQRYERLVEYTRLVMALLKGGEPVTVEGKHYRVRNLKVAPELAPELLPEVFVSGSSEAGLDAARELGALAVRYPKPAAEYEASPPAGLAARGIRVGIVARDDAAEAWAVARARFPYDRKGELMRQLATKVSDSEWHRQLADLAKEGPVPDSPYWMLPFEIYRTNCPYLVGDYDQVADEIARYAGAGYRTIILDIPASPAELEHTAEVLARAEARVAP